MNQFKNTIIKRLQVVNSHAIDSSRARMTHTLSEDVSYYQWITEAVDQSEIGPLNIYSLENVYILSSGRLQLYCHSSFLPIEEDPLNPGYVRNIYRERLGSLYLSPHEMDLNYVNDDCYLLAGWSPFEWGHFVVDYIPKILVLKEYLETAQIYPIYISSLTPDYIKKIIYSLLGSCVEIRCYDDNSITIFKHAMSPQYAQFLNHSIPGYHPAVYSLIDKWLIQATKNEFQNTSKPVRIFVSRKYDSDYKPLNPLRPIINEDEVIDTFSRRGFDIVRMEDYDFTEKVSLLNRCSVIAGGWGSGLHNSLLSACKPAVVSLGLGFNSAQPNICRLMDQPYFEIPTYKDAQCTKMLEDINRAEQFVNMRSLNEILNAILKD